MLPRTAPIRAVRALGEHTHLYPLKPHPTMIVSPRDGCAQSADCASQPTSAGTHGRELSRVAPGQGQDAEPSICGEYTHLSRYASILTHRHVQTYATRRQAARASAEDRGSLPASRPALGLRSRLTCMQVRPLSILSSRCLCSPDTCRSLQTKAEGRTGAHPRDEIRTYLCPPPGVHCMRSGDGRVRRQKRARRNCTLPCAHRSPGRVRTTLDSSVCRYLVQPHA
ncbi:hypothetical protein C8Q76DRAFT_22774 [Earliella scabrosa]|nr:hypothetical protein C8Q76DRAFT_22774 [Earliella scabrosa]